MAYAKTLTKSLFIVVVALGATSCATTVNKTNVVEQGPELNVNGRISVRKVGEQLLIGTYTWNRGAGLNGWTESLEIKNVNGLTYLDVDSDDKGTIVKYYDRSIKVPSMQYLFEKEMGINITPKVLASWFENDHFGVLLPDQVDHQGLILDVLERDGKGLPFRIRLRQSNTIALMTIRREFQ